MYISRDTIRIEEYVLDLIGSINPFSYFNRLKDVTIFTSATKNDISSLFNIIKESERKLANIDCKQFNNSLPNIVFKSHDNKCLYINTKKYLFCS